MYTGAIIGYLAWPVVILISYLAIRWALNRFEKHLPPGGDEEG